MIKIKKKDLQIESEFVKIVKHYNQIGVKLVSLGLGEPFINTPLKISKSSYKSQLSGKTKYSDPQGLDLLRKKISKSYKENHELVLNYKNFVITAGAKMALFLAMDSILDSKDEVIFFKPCYPAYSGLFEYFRNTKKIKTKYLDFDENFDFNIKKLNKLITHKTKAVVLNYPNNPTGKILTKDFIHKLVSNLSKKNIWILSDEVYEYIISKKDKFYPMISQNKDIKKIITISGFSKTYSMTGWRVGYLHTFDRDLLNKIIRRNQLLLTNIPEFIQYACIEALKDKKTKKIINKNIESNYEYLKKKLSQINLFSYNSYQGGLFLFIKINSSKINGDKFCSILLKKYKVATIPGIFFGKRWKHYFRVSLSVKNRSFKLGINKIFNYAKKIKN